MIKLGWQENEIGLGKLTAVYVEEKDTKFYDKDLQRLEISYKRKSTGGYFTLETSGWSFDTLDELVKVLEDFKAKIHGEKE